MPTALVILANGSEEMEAVISIDVLRRGDVDVTVAGLNSDEAVKCSRNVVIKPDTSLQNVENKEFDVIVLPGGGPGAASFEKSDKVGEILKRQEGRGCFIAAICAAPIALLGHKVASGKKVTSHPAVEQRMKDGGYDYSEERVVIDGKTVTSRGPGTAFEFALALVELLQGKEKRDAIVPPMLLKF